MATGAGAEQGRRVTTVLREGEQVTPLELFFDLVFVLAITQCTALMAGDPTWEGLGKGILVLGMLWWAWVGYAWLTSVVDPEEGVVRIAIFAAMAALLVVSLCVPQAFGDLGLTFAIFYGLVRAGQLALFVVASRDAPTLRHSIWIGPVPSTGAGVAPINKQRLLLALVLLALAPIGDELDALAALGIVAGLMVALITYEAIRFAEGRDQVRHAEGQVRATSP